ncbi:hypothetical protein WDW89_22085 [Deltaproteobacteria bacterium TL4]
MKILVFSPYLAIETYSTPLALLAEDLSKQGNEVVVVCCNRLYSQYCDAMRALGKSVFAQDKASVCKRCQRKQNFFQATLQRPFLQIDDYIEAFEREKIEHLLNEIDHEKLDFLYEGIPILKISLYLIVTTYKKLSFKTFSKEEMSDYKHTIRNVLLTIVSFKKILAEVSPEVCFVYNGLYPVNHALLGLTQQTGTLLYSLHGSMGLHKLEAEFFISKNHGFTFTEATKQVWPQFQNRPCPQSRLCEVTNHLFHLFNAQSGWVYSQKASEHKPRRAQWGIQANQVVFLATMSSLDELHAAQTVGVVSSQKLLFDTPLEWLESLIEYFRIHPEWFLIIRPHPREFPNQTSSIKSEYAQHLEKALTLDLPPNITVNWPSAQISLYNLMEITDVILNAWSSAGEELGCMGIPIVHYCPVILNYPGELDYVGTTLKEYRECLHQAAEEEWSFERIRRFYRWKVLQFCRTTLPIYNENKQKKYSLPRRVFRKINSFIDPIYYDKQNWKMRNQDLEKGARLQKLIGGAYDTLAHLELEEYQDGISCEEENLALKNELKRVYQRLYGGNPPLEKRNLQYQLWEHLNALE